MRKGSTVVSVYLDPEMYLFISDVARCEGRSRTRQIERVIHDWEKNWIEEYGPDARQKMRELVKAMETTDGLIRQEIG